MDYTPDRRRLMVVLTAMIGLLSLISPVFANGQVAADASAGPECPQSGGKCGSQHQSSASGDVISARARLLRQLVKGDRIRFFERFGGPGPIVNRRGFEATLRLVGPNPERVVASLRKIGVSFERRDTQIVRVGRIFQAFIPWNRLDRTASVKQVLRIEPTWVPRIERPLETTSKLVGAAPARRVPEIGLTGEGTTLADLDSGFDIFHPHFFRPDAGYRSWVDVDDNGVLDPGTDGIDADGDGEIEAGEKLQLLDSADVTLGTPGGPGLDETLEPREDWLYIDKDDNGTRDVGPENGFEEADPAYGEPTFVFDDVDRNGEAEADEKLVQLGTSKFDHIVRDEKTFERGDDLIEYGLAGSSRRPYHGTGTTSVLAGGQSAFHDRIGLAPGADLVGYHSGNQETASQDSQLRQLDVAKIEDAVDTGVDVLLYEFGLVALIPIDGSTNFEEAMDRAMEESEMAQITPLGNLNAAQKHAQKKVEPDKKTAFAFRVGDGLRTRQGRVPFTSVWSSLYWKSDQKLKVTIIDPDGKKASFDPSGASSPSQDVGKDVAVFRHGVTPRGTHQVHMYVVSADRRSSIRKGDWTIEVSNAEESDTVWGRVTDAYSSWSARGIHWKSATADQGTMVFPSTADSGVGVGAFGTKESRRGTPPGNLRRYSGRGPRIDGARGADFAAPADPYAAFGLSQRYAEEGYPHSMFFKFGGTSGAGPHVAAAFALMRQAHPEWKPDRIEKELAEAAERADLEPDFGETPNPHWGHGKINVYGAVTDRERPEKIEDPDLALNLSQRGQKLVIDASDSGPAELDSLEYRYDETYDGSWDTDWSDKQTHTFEPDVDKGDKIAARVQVRNKFGRKDGQSGSLVWESPTKEGGDVVEHGGGETVDAGTDVSDTPTARPTVVEETNRQDLEDSGCGCDTSDRNGPIPVLWLFMLGVWSIRRRTP